MNPKIKALWVATLRSGNYDQGIGSLRSASGRCCCLGVLCDIEDPDKWKYDEFKYSHKGQTSLPSGGFCGLSTNTMQHLARMNDAGKSFAKIADYIERNL